MNDLFFLRLGGRGELEQRGRGDVALAFLEALGDGLVGAIFDVGFKVLDEGSKRAYLLHYNTKRNFLNT